VVQREATLDHIVAGSDVSGDEAVVVHVLATAARLGGPMAATVQSGAALLRERAAVREEARAHSAQARLSARVLTVVPMSFAAWSYAASSSFRHAVATPAGSASIAAGVAFNVVGWWWMRHIVREAWT
jgi:tight adherence protein B